VEKLVNRLLILIITSLFLSSCDLKAPEVKKEDTDISANEQLKISDNRDLNSTELDYAKKICLALEDKTETFNRLIGEARRYTFLRRINECSDSERALSDHSVVITAPDRFGDPLVFKPISTAISNFTYNVFTHEENVIKSTCAKVLGGDNVLPKLIQPIGKDFVKFRFYTADTFEYFIYLKNGDNWYAKRFESIKVILSSNSNDYGVVSQRIFGGYCPNGRQSYVIQQLK